MADQTRALRTRKSFLEFSRQESKYLKSATSLSSSFVLRVRCIPALLARSHSQLPTSMNSVLLWLILRPTLAAHVSIDSSIL